MLLQRLKIKTHYVYTVETASILAEERLEIIHSTQTTTVYFTRSCDLKRILKVLKIV